eukprot:TRINITY_DN2724_c2_g1_i1.p1 TRINITY_DN2724_c2_g1~~TRINITY_DN2724_c2_g1_i1.p1  ORF type:complete len:335 (+),score=105.11 TRINITY_DN2724_c2_g1_i1:54-1058(+)
MPYTRVGESRNLGINMYYELHGNGPVKVLLVMGMQASAKEWYPQIEFFQDKKEYQVCAFDNRGYGRTDTPYTGYSSSNLALDAIDLVNHLQWDQFHLVGLSMGGMISLELALNAINRITSLALCVTHRGGPDSRPPGNSITKTWSALRAATPADKAKINQTSIFSPAYLTKIHEGEVTQLDYHAQRYLDNFTGDNPLKKPSLTGLFGHLKVCWTHFISDERLDQLKHSGIPILIITGTIDELVSDVNSRKMHDHFGTSELVVLEGAGHGVHIEEAEKFNEALLRHIQKATEKANTLSASDKLSGTQPSDITTVSPSSASSSSSSSSATTADAEN